MNRFHGKGFEPNYNIYSCYCFQMQFNYHIDGNFSSFRTDYHIRHCILLGMNDFEY